MSNTEHFNIPDLFSHQENKYLVTTGGSSRGLQCTKGLVVELPEVKVKDALAYFFRKSSLEIQHFVPKHKYSEISKEIDGILYYSGRILPIQRVENKLHLADVSFDLCDKSFCVLTPSKDGRIRKVEVEYQNSVEDFKRTTIRGVRDLIVIHPMDELGLSKELFDLEVSSDYFGVGP